MSDRDANYADAVATRVENLSLKQRLAQVEKRLALISEMNAAMAATIPERYDALPEEEKQYHRDRRCAWSDDKEPEFPFQPDNAPWR